MEILHQIFQHAAKQLGNLAGWQMLDYGCGTGSLCRVAREHGLRPTGIEADPNARQEVLRGGSFVVYESLESLLRAEPEVCFDLIVLWNVIEHLRRPWLDLERLRGLLEPGGWLLISTPNATCLKARLLGPRWDNHANPTHFYYFTRQSLRSLLRRSGFSKIAKWQPHIAYPHHGALRRALQRALVACKLQGGLLVVASPSAEESVWQ